MSASPKAPRRSLPTRYRWERGRGAAGTTPRRAVDRELGRVVELVAAAPGDAPAFEALTRRLLDIVAPGVPAVLDAGLLPDGRPYRTSQPAASDPPQLDQLNQRAAVELIARAARAVGAAHAAGVAHGDVHIGTLGLDAAGGLWVRGWEGAATFTDARSALPELREFDLAEDERTRALTTTMPTRAGDPASMAPEVVLGVDNRHRPQVDVYALGCLLYRALAGVPPYRAIGGLTVAALIASGPPVPLPARHRGLTIPGELRRLCDRAMARSPAARPTTATELAQELWRWLERWGGEAEAVERVERAQALQAEELMMRDRARQLGVEAARLLSALPMNAPAADKVPAWAMEDEAERLLRDCDLQSDERLSLLRDAVAHDPGNIQAWSGQVEWWKAALERAEAAGDTLAAARAEAGLRAVAERETTGRTAFAPLRKWVRGQSKLTLATDPPGADVALFRSILQDRRRVYVRVGELGRTPLRGVDLPMGSYRLELRAPGRITVRYPVHLPRGEHWEGVAPGERSPYPIYLPKPDDLADEDIYVPAGWFQAGGDPLAVQGGPRRALWCDGFVIRRFPVTHSQYLAFLDDLVETGVDPDPFLPRGSDPDGPGQPIYERDRYQRFALQTGDERWDPDWPVMLLSWHAAAAFARWRARRSQLPWRLPSEWEWEKAARGVDGRPLPWGDHFDPSWCHMLQSHAVRPQLAVVGAVDGDESVYGVRDMAGGVRDWTGTVWRLDGLPEQAERVPDDPDPDVLGATEARAVRGGSWLDGPGPCRAAEREGELPAARHVNVGVRLARPLG